MVITDNRLILEEKDLNNAIMSGEINNYTWGKNYSNVIVDFNGPKGTQYIINIIFPKEYPFKRPNAYFIGAAPDHPFYRFDTDDIDRSKRCTNLANTDFGLLYQTFTPRITAAEYIRELQSSLTPEGTKSMSEHMAYR